MTTKDSRLAPAEFFSIFFRSGLQSHFRLEFRKIWLESKLCNWTISHFTSKYLSADHMIPYFTYRGHMFFWIGSFPSGNNFTQMPTLAYSILRNFKFEKVSILIQRYLSRSPNISKSQWPIFASQRETDWNRLKGLTGLFSWMTNKLWPTFKNCRYSKSRFFKCNS